MEKAPCKIDGPCYGKKAMKAGKVMKKTMKAMRVSKKAMKVVKGKKVMKVMKVKRRRPAVARAPKTGGAKSWHKPVPGAASPNWALHFVKTLSAPLLNLKKKIPDGTQLVIWSDCAGKGTEKYAAQLLADELRKTLGVDIQFKLHAGSDKSRHCRDFVTCNYEPVHFTDDIFCRDFEAATFDCTKCGHPCSLPRSGVDFYWCCFPCGPWSKRGKRLGLADRHADVCWQTIKSIYHMQPVMFVMENVVDICHPAGEASESDMQVIQAYMKEKLCERFGTVTIKKSSPVHHGYPTEKTRVLVIGGRSDQIDLNVMQNTFAKLIENPMPVNDTYLTLLGIQSQGDEVLNSVGQLPTPEAAVTIQSSGCKCGVDPMIVCPRHPCNCEKCRRGQRLECTWRAKATAYLADAGLEWTVADGCVTYIQALELADKRVPHSARERNLLNIFARLPAAHPLRDTRMIFDLTQAVDRCRAKFDGTVPTMATNAVMWSMRACRALTVSEMAKLMGQDLCKADLRFTTENQMRQMLGMSMHVATAGFALAGLLAAVGADSK